MFFEIAIPKNDRPLRLFTLVISFQEEAASERFIGFRVLRHRLKDNLSMRWCLKADRITRHPA